eukprot:11221310-Lingulodinium_polyedra.AAC.1
MTAQDILDAGLAADYCEVGVKFFCRFDRAGRCAPCIACLWARASCAARAFPTQLWEFQIGP